MKINPTDTLHTMRYKDFDAAALPNNPTHRPNREDAAEISKVSKEFESLFIEIMLKSMRSTVAGSGLVNESNGEKIFREMLDTEYSKGISQTGHFGISKSLESQFHQKVAQSIETQRGTQAYKAAISDQ